MSHENSSQNRDFPSYSSLPVPSDAYNSKYSYHRSPALEGTDIDAIKDKTKALNDKAMALATKVYEEAAKTAEANKNNDSSDKNDGAEEAEFVNKD